MAEHRAIELDQLEDGKPTEVELGDTKVVLVRQGDRVHAVAATCPHKGVPLKNGVVIDGRIVCPAHRAIFDLEDGSLLAPPACEAIASYPARLEDGTVMVEIDMDAPAHPIPAMARRGDDARRFVIVGSGAAGWRAAETLRREGFEGEVVVVTDEGDVPLDRTAFSKGYLKKEGDAEAPSVRKASDIGSLDIELHQGRAVELDPDAMELTLEGADTPLSYDKLLIATGCGSRKLNLPGAELEGIHTIRTKSDADALRADVARVKKTGDPVRLAIVGGGFIGLEVAAALGDPGTVDVTVLLQEDIPLAKKFGDAFGSRILDEHLEAGIAMRTGVEVAGFSGDGRVGRVELGSGDSVDCDIVLMAVGAVPRTDWLPFVRNDDGGIDVGADLSVPGHPNVFLAGDIAKVPTSWGAVRIEHWRFAQETGELAARNMLGAGKGYEGTPFFWTMQHASGSYSYTGHAESFDRIEGSPVGDKFALALVSEGMVPAILALGFDDRVTRMERAMAGRGGVPEADAPSYGGS